MDKRLQGKYEVNSQTGCWEWTAHKQGGYGRVRVGLKLVMAHRYSYELSNGKIQSGYIVCHRCDNPACINPGHLFLGTQKDNSDDKIRKGRWRGPYEIGVDTPEAVKVRAAWLANPGVSQREIARICSVSPMTAGKYRAK